MDHNLLSYVKTVVEIEKTVYTQTQLQKELKKKIDLLGIPTEFERPIKGVASFKENVTVGVFFSGLICAIIGAVYGLISSKGLFSAIFNIIGNGISGIIIGVIIGVVAGIVLYFIENKRLEDDYQYELAAYQKDLKQDKQRVDKEKEQAKQLKMLIAEIGDRQVETEQLRQAYYNAGQIHPDYRTLHGMCAIYDYLEKEICTELKGPYGVYNQLRMDARFTIVYEKLDVVISKLESIKDYNRVLYQAIQEENRNIKRLVEKTDQQIKLSQRNNQLLEINNYNQQQQLRESKYQSNLQTYALIKWERS